jgi:hypothetical protein
MVNLFQGKTSAKLMAALYGVDAGSLKKNLALIMGKSKDLSLRKSSEIRKQFDEAFDFLQKANCIEGVAILKKMEGKMLH